MMIKDLKIVNSWKAVTGCARTTVSKEGEKEPSSLWKKKILLAEHSPIRQLIFRWKWVDLPYWVSVHFVRHKIGIEHFVSTQRTERTGEDRNAKQQDALVTHECVANAQALINISRKRLCSHASKETRVAWMQLLTEIDNIEPELSEVCVPECYYRGFCPELKSCGYIDSQHIQEDLKNYRRNK